MRKYLNVSLIFIILTIAILGLVLITKPAPGKYFDKITLRRTQCFGFCPVYSLTILGNGQVIYRGEKFVKIKGKRVSHIDDSKIRELAQEFRDVNYFSLKNNYENFSATDMPYAITSITIKGKTKKVKHYHGDFSAPKTLTRLEDKIDKLAGTKKWIK